MNRKDELLDALQLELELARDYLNGEAIETIYFGGGTPSLLDAGELNRLFEKIYTTFPVDELKEVTLEANPDDLSGAYLKSLRSTPISRFSIGVQSFREEDLRYMNRAHNAQQADYAIKAAQDAGFTNLSIDLIYGTPGLTDLAWKENLAKMNAMAIPHFSAYALTVEEGTALHHSISKKKTAPVDAAQSAAQFEQLMELAPTLGYEHYEISNLAKPGMYAAHNTAYWQGKPYLGIGPSAHSFDGKQERRWNVANNTLYLQSILNKREIPLETEILTTVQRLNEYIMTSLRTIWGCSLPKIAADWGSRYLPIIMESAGEALQQGKLELKENILLLTNKGRLFADGIAGDLFVDEALV